MAKRIMVKKTLGLLLLSALMIVGCGACQKNKSASSEAVVEGDTTQIHDSQVKDDNQLTTDDDQSTQDDRLHDDTQVQQADKEKAEIIIPKVVTKEYKIPDTSALQFVADMKIGWNLGNTFDAFTETNTLADEMKYETSWCGALTSKDMILKLKEAGFNTIRVPVSWHNHLNDDNFTISDTWLNRVQEVVDYAIQENMYVILNIHHDCYEGYYYPSEKNLTTSKKYVKNIWNQLSKRFASYDNHLIFESINEPRLTGTDNEWWLDMSKDQCKEAVDCINELNQVFVDTVRKSSGNNKTRYLMVPGYDASAEYALLDQFKMPEDSKKNTNRIIVSVHAYTPYRFALQASNESGSVTTFDKSCEDEITSFMDRLYDKYIVNNIPVVIGEFGARDKGDNLQERVNFTAFYIANAKARGISCCWWDNNSFAGNGENFGLFNRKTLTFEYPELLASLMQYVE